MGGIYRDCWLIAHDNVFITDPNYENVTAGGGLAINFSDVSEKSARADIKAHIRNDGKKTFSGKITYILTGPDGKELKTVGPVHSQERADRKCFSSVSG